MQRMPGHDARKTVKKPLRANQKPALRGDAAGIGAAAGPERGAREDRVAELEAECRRLRAELATAQARIDELESTRDEVLDRIAWVIDSLHSLVEDQ